jgi:hypothetical protein
MFERIGRGYGPQHHKNHDATIFQHVYTFIFSLSFSGYILIGSNVDDNDISKPDSYMLQRSINLLEIDFLSKMLYALK